MIKNQVVALRPDDQFYPQGLHYYFGKNAPSAVFALGNIEILKARTVAIFCSIKCPGDLILKTYDLARIFRDHEITVIGGFHSPMEKECLSLLLRGKQPIILCPARTLEGLRFPKDWKLPLEQGRLLLLSPFAENLRRTTAELAVVRNRFVAAIAHEIFVAYAAAGSKTERFCQEVFSMSKPLFTFDQNTGLIALGASACLSWGDST